MNRLEVRPKPASPYIVDAKLGLPSDPLSGVGVALAYVRAGQEQNVREAAVVLAVARSIETVRHQAKPSRHPRAARSFASTGAGAPCDGDLPPCWRIIGTESGGRWDAYNPGGCVEHGVVFHCFGPYQFSGSWAGKLGLPADLTQTTHEQWINAARQLWNHGAGCSNWSACG